MIEYDQRHSRDSILRLSRDGYLELGLTISEKGKDLVDPPPSQT